MNLSSLSACKFFITDFEQLNYDVPWCGCFYGHVSVLMCAHFRFIKLLRNMSLTVIIASNLFSVSSSFWDLRPHTISHSSLMSYTFLKILFSFCVLIWMLSIAMPLCSLTLSFTMYNLMLFPSSAFFSDIVVFISRKSFWEWLNILYLNFSNILNMVILTRCRVFLKTQNKLMATQ